MKNKLFFVLGFSLLLISFSFPGNAQQDPGAAIQAKLTSFNKQFLQEKIYLHTDKNFYLAGEIVWFKLYYVDALSYKPLDLSKVGYVEILDRNSKPVLQAKISLTIRGGFGSFYLPLTLKSDHYTIRAYTNWMRNFSTTAFFEAPLSIVNTVSSPTGANTTNATAAVVDFFPESGQLVQGIESKMAFRITNPSGRGVSASGIVTNASGDTITQFSAGLFGMGTFMFKPIAGNSYKAFVTLPDGKTISKELPSAQDKGYVMMVTDNQDGRYRVRVQAKGNQTVSDAEEVTLLAHDQGTIGQAQQASVRYGNELVLYIDKSKLKEGVNFLTLFNRQQQPVAERLVFIKPAKALTTNTSLSKKSFQKREKVDISIAFDNPSGRVTDTANYSVSVYQVDSLSAFDGQNIIGYKWLHSSLQGKVESPSYYFSEDAGVAEATDNLLLTHGWRRFKWSSLLQPPVASALKYIPEYAGHLVNAKVTRRQDGKPAAGVLCFLTVPSVPYGFYTAESDAEGMLQFEVKDYYGAGEIVLKTSDTLNTYRVDLINPFVEDEVNLSLPAFSIANNDADKILDKSIAMQVQNLYRADSLRKYQAPAIIDTLPFFGRAEFSYLLDDYKRFTTMEEVMREYVFPVTVSMRGGKLSLNIQDGLYSQTYDDNILVLIDGVPLGYHNKIFAYDPLKVKKLDIVTRRYLLGTANFSGIASFETIKGKFDAFDLDPGVINIDYDGLQLHREFYAPDYARTVTDNRLPDMRTTLHWVPQLISKASGTQTLSFFTSDQPGKFMVIVEGITDEGQAVSSSSSFTVE